MESTAKIFKNGRSQAIRLPKDFRFKGTEVKIRKDGEKIILEPIEKSQWSDGFWDRFKPDPGFEIPSPKDLSISAITLAEIYYGIEKSPVKKKGRRAKIEQIRSTLEVCPFDELAAADYRVIRAQLEKEGVVISERDLQIASIAFSKGFCLITHNVREFRRVEKLEFEDWAEI